MSFLDGLKAGLGLSPTAPGGPSHLVKSTVDPFGGTGISLQLFDTGSGSLQRGSAELLSAYRSNPTVRKVVGLIANQLAATEFYVEKIPSGVKRSKALSTRGKSLHSSSDHITDHPFLDFLYAGNPALAGPSGLKLSFVYYLLKGEFFWLLTPLPDGGLGWLVIPPTWVVKTPSPDGGHYEVRFGAKQLKVPAEAMLWIRDPDVLNPFGRGVGAGDSLRDEVDTDEYASALMRYTLANKGLLDGVLNVEGASRESLQAARMEFERNHRGVSNSGKVLVIDGTAVKYMPLSQSFSELQLLELREREKTIIEETFCVPPELFGKVSSSNRATIYEARNIFANNVLIPALNLFVTELSLRVMWLFDPKGQYVLDYISPAPADEERLIQLMTLSPHSFTANEIRQAADLPQAPWGDVRYISAMNIEVPAPMAAKRNRAAAISTDKALATKATGLLTQQQIDQILALYNPSELGRILGPQWRQRMQDIAADELAKLGVSAGFEVVNPMINAHVENFALDRLKIPIGTSQQFAASQIAAGVDNLESIQSIAKRLVAIGATDQNYRARLIARTEVVRSTNVGRLATWQASGLPGLQKQWLSGLTADTRKSHEALHNKTVPLNEPFEFSGALAPGIEASTLVPGDSGYAAHDCNCLPPGQVVEGRFVGGVRGEYSGRVVTINTLKGNQVTLTPNHPVLTARGWVAAHAIGEGDHLVCQGFQVGAGVATHQVDNGPTAIEQVFGTLAQAGVTGGRRLAPVDLHGDAVAMAPNVDVVDVNLGLLLHLQAAVLEQLKNGSLKLPRSVALARGSSDELGIGSGSPTDCAPSLSALALEYARLILSLCPPISASFGEAANWATSLHKPRGQDASAVAGFLRDLHESSAGLVSTDQVVKVGDERYSGHVYDLQSVNGWYIAQGIVISNCVCTSTAFDPEHGKSFAFGSSEHVTAMKAFDDQRRDWEAEAAASIAKFYGRIEDETLKILGVRRDELDEI